jgi:hypothetical protein
MIKRRVPVTLFLIGIVAMTLAYSATALASTDQLSKTRSTRFDADPHRRIKVTAQQAIAIVRSTTAKGQGGRSLSALAAPPATTDLVANGPVDGAFFRYYNVAGANVTAAVDAFDGHVASLLLVTEIPSTRASALLTEAQAIGRGEAFLSARTIGTDGMSPTVEKRDRGLALTYEITWQLRVNGVKVPESRTVEMDAGTGVVFKMLDVSRPFDAPPSPSVDVNSAISRARIAAGIDQPSIVDSPQLEVTFTPAGQQMLVWTVRLSSRNPRGYEEYALVTVDAITGTASLIGRG